MYMIKFGLKLIKSQAVLEDSIYDIGSLNNIE